MSFFLSREIDRATLSWQRCLQYDNSPISGKKIIIIVSIDFNYVIDIFAGQLKSTLECSTCHYQSITFDMFWDLSIPLPRVISFSFSTTNNC